MKKIILPKETSTEQFSEALSLIAKNVLASAIPSPTTIPQGLLNPLSVVLNSSIDVLLSITSNQARNINLQKLIDQINANFADLEKKVKRNKDEYEVYWRKAIKGSIESVRDEKVKIFANALTHFAISDERPFSTNSSILNDINFLEVEHMYALKIVYERDQEEELRQKRDISYRKNYCSLDDIAERMKITQGDAQKLGSDLLARGLVEDALVGKWGYHGFFKVRMSQYGRYFVKAIEEF